jgi:hypothetical protein
MTIEQIRRLYNAQPFQPFIIHLADGREISVPHRDFFMMVPSGRTLIVALPDDTVDIIDLLLVTDIELRSNGNGRQRRRKRDRH